MLKLYRYAGIALIALAGVASRCAATVNVTFGNTASPSLQAAFIANTTGQYLSTLTPNPFFKDTYSLVINGLNPAYVLPPPPQTVNAQDLLKALVQSSSSTYPYGWADGIEYGRYVDVGSVGNKMVACSTPTVFNLVQSSTGTWSPATCNDALWTVYENIVQLNYSTPTAVPGY